MTATERLRAMLDERGVEYETDDTQVSETEWYYVTKLRDGYSDRWTYEEPPDCDLLVSYQYDLGAEDAIAATLGAGTCHDANVGGYFVCSKCEALVKLHSIGRSYVDEYGKRWYATSDEHGLNFCPNCGRRIVEPTTNGVDAEEDE